MPCPGQSDIQFAVFFVVFLEKRPVPVLEEFVGPGVENPFVLGADERCGAGFFAVSRVRDFPEEGAEDNGELESL